MEKSDLIHLREVVALLQADHPGILDAILDEIDLSQDGLEEMMKRLDKATD